MKEETEFFKNNKLNDYLILKVIQIMAPLIPHLSEEMWQKAGFNDSVFRSEWPVYDPEAVVGDTMALLIEPDPRKPLSFAVKGDQ